jgi:hypothetical protein
LTSLRDHSASAPHVLMEPRSSGVGATCKRRSWPREVENALSPYSELRGACLGAKIARCTIAVPP